MIFLQIHICHYVLDCRADKHTEQIYRNNRKINDITYKIKCCFISSFKSWNDVTFRNCFGSFKLVITHLYYY